jgi:hypothetical protein
MRQQQQLGGGMQPRFYRICRQTEEVLSRNCAICKRHAKTITHAYRGILCLYSRLYVVNCRCSILIVMRQFAFSCDSKINKNTPLKIRM